MPAPPAIRPVPDNAFVAPESELEHRPAHEWERILGVAPVGVTDSFFDLGGDCLRAMLFVGAAERERISGLGVAMLPERHTIRRLLA